ncbi:MAG: hypothetical protein KAJ93_08730 [Methanosarcinales archaeon]|nr:hypothetical protein [Methanosarcinales archaeon]
MTSDHDVLKWLKDKDENLYNRVRGKCSIDKNSGEYEQMIEVIIEALEQYAVPKN